MTRGSTKFKKGQPRNDTTFKPGQSGNPGGRPVNARNRITKALLLALAEDFEAHGKDAIAKARAADPMGYVRALTALLPKTVEVGKPGEFDEMSDGELADYIAREVAELGAGRAHAPRPESRGNGKGGPDSVH